MSNANTSKLQETFSSAPPAEHVSRWDELYATAFHPWDRGAPSLALADLLAQRTDLIPPAQDLASHGQHPVRDAAGRVVKRTALVPGCGFGHDALLLASRGYDVWGVDGSERAVAGARAREAEVAALLAGGQEGVYATGEGVERGQVRWVAADFFAQGWEKGLGRDGSGTFDLIFDYTFLCALPLEVRPAWARRITSLLAHDADARLICLEFPTGKPHTEAGPPWGVWPETYEALLSFPGEEVEYNEDGTPRGGKAGRPGVGDVEGVHRLCLSKPLRTHDVGTGPDGSVRDFISVWSR